MFTFNKNYLGHELQQLFPNEKHPVIFICNKCNSRIWTNSQRFLLNKNGTYENLISCDEMVIKNIIE